MLIETIFDVRNAEIALAAAKKTAPSLPVMLSFSVSTPDGHNMLGQSIMTLDKVSGIQHINLKRAPKGMYFVQIRSGNNIEVKKLIVE